MTSYCVEVKTMVTFGDQLTNKDFCAFTDYKKVNFNTKTMLKFSILEHTFANALQMC